MSGARKPWDGLPCIDALDGFPEFHWDGFDSDNLPLGTDLDGWTRVVDRQYSGQRKEYPYYVAVYRNASTGRLVAVQWRVLPQTGEESLCGTYPVSAYEATLYRVDVSGFDFMGET